MTKELDKKRLLAILEKKAKAVIQENPKSDSYKMSLFLDEDLHENGVNIIEYPQAKYVAELLIEIEQNTHRRFEFRNPFPVEVPLPADPIRSMWPDNKETSTAYEVIFFPARKTKESIKERLRIVFSPETNVLQYEDDSLKVDSKQMLEVFSQLAEANGRYIETAYLLEATGAKTAKSLNQIIRIYEKKMQSLFQYTKAIIENDKILGYRIAPEIKLSIEKN